MDLSTDDFFLKCTIPATSAGSRIVLLENDSVNNGRRCYIKNWWAAYDGATAWSGGAATEIYIESVDHLGGDRFITIPLTSMSTTQITGPWTAGVVLADIYYAASGGIASSGISIVADDDAAAGDDIIIILDVRVSIFPE